MPEVLLTLGGLTPLVLNGSFDPTRCRTKSLYCSGFKNLREPTGLDGEAFGGLHEVQRRQNGDQG